MPPADASTAMYAVMDERSRSRRLQSHGMRNNKSPLRMPRRRKVVVVVARSTPQEVHLHVAHRSEATLWWYYSMTETVPKHLCGQLIDECWSRNLHSRLTDFTSSRWQSRSRSKACESGGTEIAGVRRQQPSQHSPTATSTPTTPSVTNTKDESDVNHHEAYSQREIPPLTFELKLTSSKLARMAAAGAAGAHPIHVHPARPLYRFMATGLGASMWFFVCLGPRASVHEQAPMSEYAAGLTYSAAVL